MVFLVKSPFIHRFPMVFLHKSRFSLSFLWFSYGFQGKLTLISAIVQLCGATSPGARNMRAPFDQGINHLAVMRG
jgi:hypothetical protein